MTGRLQIGPYFITNRGVAVENLGGCEFDFDRGVELICSLLHGARLEVQHS